MGGAFGDALKMANAAIAIDPKNAGVLALKASALFKLKDTDGAIASAKEALGIDPGNTGCKYRNRCREISLGDTDGALQALASVASDHKDDLGVLLLKINIFDHMGNFQQAESQSLRLVSKSQ